MSSYSRATPITLRVELTRSQTNSGHHPLNIAEMHSSGMSPRQEHAS